MPFVNIKATSVNCPGADHPPRELHNWGYKKKENNELDAPRSRVQTSLYVSIDDNKRGNKSKQYSKFE